MIRRVVAHHAEQTRQGTHASRRSPRPATDAGADVVFGACVTARAAR
jgi:hypothetical protein